jgi:CheY-like chemotaxis protein
VLVVEDDDAVRALAVRALEGAGYHVVASSGGRAALEAARAVRSLDLLLTDVVMPEMNGRELAEEVRRIAPGARVLYMSGYTHNAIVHHGVLDAGIEFLPKPFTPSTLVARVREVLDAR